MGKVCRQDCCRCVIAGPLGVTVVQFNFLPVAKT